MHLAVDVGHGYVKALAVSGGRALFPSLIIPAARTVELVGYAHERPVLLDGAPYWVGEVARRAGATALWSRDKAADTETFRLAVVAAARLGADGPVRIATGLPLAWFAAQRQALAAAWGGRTVTVQIPGEPARCVWFETVTVLPQGVAAAAAVLARPGWAPGPYLVCDVGYRTTDWICVERSADGRLQYDPTAADSVEGGTGDVARRVAAALTDETGVPFSPAEVETADVVHVRGRAVPLDEPRRAARQAVARQLHDRLAEALGDRIAKLAGLVAVGGGAALAADAWPEAVIPADPQWANAAAYRDALLAAAGPRPAWV
jgi:hypothetical protein